jgi:CheY-like chemotaxis protein/anti-sigma regulatory factor (Ser/Thr protein kinase)
MQDLVDSQTSAAEVNGNVLEWAWVGAALDWVQLDASRLQQVMLNLVGNAIKFTRQGHIQIEMEQIPAVEIAEETVAGSSEGATFLEVRIIDTGVGIAEADLARVFEDFQTIASPLAHSTAGTGLGLGIAQRFVRAMGGEIGAESTVGEGSVFWLRLPVMPTAKPAQDRIRAQPDSQTPERDILVVEDNEINLQLARDMLRRQGHKVTIARNGEDGVEAAASHRFDLILMDIRMPVMDGLAATRAIREGQGACREVPIVALSANVLPESRTRFIAGGMSDFLGKPLVKEELMQVIARFCGDAHQPAAETSPPEAAPQDPMAHLKARYVAETDALFDWLAETPQDWTEIADRAHRIAGSAAAFGHADLRMTLLHVEAAAEAADPAALQAAVRDARDAWQAAPAPSLV